MTKAKTKYTEPWWLKLRLNILTFVKQKLDKNSAMMTKQRLNVLTISSTNKINTKMLGTRPGMRENAMWND